MLFEGNVPNRHKIIKEKIKNTTKYRYAIKKSDSMILSLLHQDHRVGNSLFGLNGG